MRASRTPRRRAAFTTMRMIQVLSEDRPSNPSRPLRTPSQASCTTSSAVAWVFTYILATVIIVLWCCSTSTSKARSSPARKRASRSTSSGVAGTCGSVTRISVTGRNLLRPIRGQEAPIQLSRYPVTKPAAMARATMLFTLSNM